jgi:hypothetical protein
MTGFSELERVPEPSFLALLGSGLFAIAFSIRRLRSRRLSAR